MIASLLRKLKEKRDDKSVVTNVFFGDNSKTSTRAEMLDLVILYKILGEVNSSWGSALKLLLIQLVDSEERDNVLAQSKVANLQEVCTAHNCRMTIARVARLWIRSSCKSRTSRKSKKMYVSLTVGASSHSCLRITAQAALQAVNRRQAAQR